MNIIWSDRAKANLTQIHDYIAADSAAQARRIINELIDCAELLADFPRIGRLCRNTTEPGFANCLNFHTVSYTG